MNILVYPNSSKVDTLPILKRVIDYARKRNVNILLEPYIAEKYNYSELKWVQNNYNKVDVAISIGGDGTLLSLARKCAKFGIPVCGINIGRLGFLADIEIYNLEECLEKLFTKQYSIKERLLLNAKVHGRKKGIHLSEAVNDIVIAKSGASRMMYFDVYINNYKLASYPADGLIVSTPTGSTAYSLSAGGPIISPRVQGFVVTPICPHNPSIRPLVVDQDEVISFKFANNPDYSKCDMMLTIDGQESIDILSEDTIVICKSKYKAKIIRFEKSKFYQTLQSKLCIG